MATMFSVEWNKAVLDVCFIASVWYALYLTG